MNNGPLTLAFAGLKRTQDYYAAAWLTDGNHWTNLRLIFGAELTAFMQQVRDARKRIASEGLAKEEAFLKAEKARLNGFPPGMANEGGEEGSSSVAGSDGGEGAGTEDNSVENHIWNKQLRSLKSLFDDGILTEIEYTTAKERVLTKHSIGSDLNPSGSEFMASARRSAEGLLPMPIHTRDVRLLRPWLADLGMSDFLQQLQTIGVDGLSDLKHVTELDLEEMRVPRVKRRRFLIRVSLMERPMQGMVGGRPLVSMPNVTELKPIAVEFHGGLNESRYHFV